MLTKFAILLLIFLILGFSISSKVLLNSVDIDLFTSIFTPILWFDLKKFNMHELSMFSRIDG